MTVVAVLGPTAAGKSDLAMRLAVELDGEILSVDSMQVYRGMDIGTAKPSAADQGQVAHHLIDIADPQDDFTVADFQRAGRAALEDVLVRGRVAIVVGGTGLHFRALVDPLVFPPTDVALRERLEAEVPEELVDRLLTADPDAGDHVDLSNPRRVLRALEVVELTGATPTVRAGSADARAVTDYVPAIPFVGIGVDPGGDLRERIVERFDVMLDAGLVNEVSWLAPVMGRVARQAVGYKELLPVVDGTQTLEAGREAAISATAALAKRQRTFFRRDPRIRWLDPELVRARAFDLACAIIAGRRRGE